MLIEDVEYTRINTDEDNVSFKSFKTYLHYLKSLSILLNSIYMDKTRLVNFEERKNFKEYNFEKVKKLLFNAWNTEFLLNFSNNNFDLIRYSNHWLSIQAYYVIFLLGSCYFLLEEGHEKYKIIHKNFCDNISEKLISDNDFLPSPFNLFGLNGVERNNFNLKNLPNGHTFGLTSNLKEIITINDSWNLLGMFILTTRNNEFNYRRQKRLNKNKKKLKKGERKEIINGMRRTTVFDCLYRIRIRSNYRDADMFLSDIIDNNEANEFHCYLRNIVDYGAIIFENKIIQILGFEKFKEIFKEFNNKNKNNQIIERMKLYNKF
ncbi:MAG: hypothetical protein ABH956_00915 [Candidatus Nealsonbacteria bacterium]